MGSHQFFKNHSNLEVRFVSSSTSSSSSCTEKQRTCSTTQNCLFKILRTISTVPSENTKRFPSLLNSQLKDSENGGKIGFNIDLNDGFVASREIQDSDTPIDGFPTAGGENSCGVVEKCSDDVECELVKEEKSLDSDISSEVEVHMNGEFSGEILESCKLESNGACEITKIGKLEEEAKGFMGLLIEAARLIFGEFKDEDSDFEPEPEKKTVHNSGNGTKQLKRKNKCWEADYVKETVAPVIRSKRGRIQVLPCKYRDSVIEPLTRFSRNRSTIVGNRRQGGSVRQNIP